MSSISKPHHCAERASLALLSAYQEYLMTFKLMTSQVVQRARPLITHICVVGIQRVKFFGNACQVTIPVEHSSFVAPHMATVVYHAPFP